jgi:hypothetical protein
VGLYRRGRLTETDLDVQMDNIASAQALLANLRQRLDEPVSWEQKRRLIEVLVAGIWVDTVETGGVKQSEMGGEYVSTGDPVYAGDHPFPGLQPGAGGEARWPSSWSARGRAWVFRRRSPPSGLGWTPVR